MGNSVTGTMYLPCPGCSVVRTLRVSLNRYSIGRALRTNCPRCAQKRAQQRRGPGMAAANAAELAEEVAFLGGSAEQVAERFGVTPGAIARRFQRAGMHEQARPFQRAEKEAQRRRAAA
jgi:hypothetical protein